MKRVILRDRATFKAREVFTAVVENPPLNQGVTYGEMHKRARLLDALEQHKGESFVDLEDADHALLRQLVDGFAFATAKRELRLILDDFVQAKSPEETVTLKVIEGESA